MYGMRKILALIVALTLSGASAWAGQPEAIDLDAAPGTMPNIIADGETLYITNLGMGAATETIAGGLEARAAWK